MELTERPVSGACARTLRQLRGYFGCSVSSSVRPIDRAHSNKAASGEREGKLAGEFVALNLLSTLFDFDTQLALAPSTKLVF